MSGTLVSRHVRLGDLVVQAGLATEEQVITAVQDKPAKKFIGTILVEQGFLTHDGLIAALHVQSLIRDGAINFKEGSRLVELVSRGQRSTTEILTRFAVVDDSIKQRLKNRLGALLIDAAIISPDDFLSALDESSAIGLPVGQTLLSRGLISEALLNQVLDTQVHIRDGVVAREQAIEQLRIGTSEPTNTVEFAQNVRMHIIRLGELLVIGRVVRRHQVLTALELSLEGPRRFLGERLIDIGACRQQVVIYALALQNMVDEHQIQPLDACARLKTKFAQAEVVEQVSIREGDFVRLLVNVEAWSVNCGPVILEKHAQCSVVSVSETTSEIEIECDENGDVVVASVRPENVEPIWSERTTQHPAKS